MEIVLVPFVIPGVKYRLSPPPPCTLTPLPYMVMLWDTYGTFTGF